jgi:hypothetical protein
MWEKLGGTRLGWLRKGIGPDGQKRTVQSRDMIDPTEEDFVTPKIKD